jgi:hypothetical protein
MQNGSVCRCGESYGSYGMVAGGACSMECSGNNMENCGGAGLNVIFTCKGGSNVRMVMMVVCKDGNQGIV